MWKSNLLLCVFFFSTCAVAQTDTPQPQILVRSLTLGIAPTVIPLQEQQRIIHEGQVHQHASTNVEDIAQRVQYGFQTLGFFKAHAYAPEVKVVSETSQQEIIDVAFSVDPGDRYRLNTITFTGQKAFTDRSVALPVLLSLTEISSTLS